MLLEYEGSGSHLITPPAQDALLSAQKKMSTINSKMQQNVMYKAHHLLPALMSTNN